MTDIVERLRNTPLTVGRLTIEGLFVEAADEIERLRDEIWHLKSENGALRKALESGNEAPIDTDRWLVLIEQREKLLAALREIASHDTGMRPDFSVGAKQAAIARRALEGSR